MNETDKAMSRRKVHVLRGLTAEEREALSQLAQSRSAPAEWVRRAKVLLLVERGIGYLTAAQAVGRRNGEGVSALVERFMEKDCRRSSQDTGVDQGVSMEISSECGSWMR